MKKLFAILVLLSPFLVSNGYADAIIVVNNCQFLNWRTDLLSIMAHVHWRIPLKHSCFGYLSSATHIEYGQSVTWGNVPHYCDSWSLLGSSYRLQFPKPLDQTSVKVYIIESGNECIMSTIPKF